MKDKNTHILIDRSGWPTRPELEVTIEAEDGAREFTIAETSGPRWNRTIRLVFRLGIGDPTARWMEADAMMEESEIAKLPQRAAAEGLAVALGGRLP